MHMCYERPGVVTAALNGSVSYDKWDRGGGGGPVAGGGASGSSSGSWVGRERDRERERERQARAHQMSNAHAPEPDASSLFSAPFRVTGSKDRVSQQIQTKLGDYHLAQTFLDDPSKSIGICAEPPSPAPCAPSRRESEFKKPAHAPQNGRVHSRPYYNKSEAPGSTTATSSAPAHRPPPLRIPNGVQHQNVTESSSQPPIESILKEMITLPTPLSVIAATPRKELENKFIFNPYTNKVQENPQLKPTNNDLKTPITKPGLDNRIAEQRSPVVSPVSKELGLSESDDEGTASTTRLHPILSPLGSGGSPSSASESSASESESSSSSVESAPPPPPPQRPSWSLSNFAPPLPPAQLDHVLQDAKDKPSPISELSDSESSSPGSGPIDRRRSSQKPQSPSSDEEPPRSQQATERPPGKRGRPAKNQPSEEIEQPPKKKRGRPPKPRVSPPVEHMPSPLDPKSHIVRKVFTPKKSEECGGKGGKGGKGKGGKGKGQVTIIEVASENIEERRNRDRSDERRKNEEAIAARLSPPVEDPRRIERSDRQSDRSRSNSNDVDKSSTLSTERLPPDRQEKNRTDNRQPERLPNRLDVRLPDKLSERDRRPSIERRSADRVPDRYVKAEADVGVVKSERTADRIDHCNERRVRAACRVMVRIPLSRLRPEVVKAFRSNDKRPLAKRPTPPVEQVNELPATNHERSTGLTPNYYPYFERFSADALSDEERDHKYYLGEATRLRTAAEREQEPLQRVMLYLESVLCFVLTGRVLELELDTKQAFTIYRETIEYIKSIHSMPQRYRASPHSTFSKLDILSLRVQALLYLRMFKMYNREVKEYYKIVQEYQQKPAIAESVSPLSPTPSPANSLTSVGSNSASSGYYSLAHSVPAHTHNALLQLTKYYTFLYVAHELWEQADCLCRLRPNQDLFITVDRKCGPLTLFSTFRHLVQYVRFAISLLKSAPRE